MGCKGVMGISYAWVKAIKPKVICDKGLTIAGPVAGEVRYHAQNMVIVH